MWLSHGMISMFTTTRVFLAARNNTSCCKEHWGRMVVAASMDSSDGGAARVGHTGQWCFNDILVLLQVSPRCNVVLQVERQCGEPPPTVASWMTVDARNVASGEMRQTLLRCARGAALQQGEEK